ncbi:MAG: TonB-dependent receptor [Bacteroidota bacterium]
MSWLLCSLPLYGQTALTGQVIDQNGRAVTDAQIIAATKDKEQLKMVGEGPAYSDAKGTFSLSGLPSAELSFYVTHPDYASWDTTVNVAYISTPLLVRLAERSYDLNTVSVSSERDRAYDLLRLRAVEGTSIYAGRKSEVVDLSRLTVNRATNNPRQIYATVAGLNIYESDDAGLQLSIGGRGLDPNRTASFNVRQNGYDISADVLGYPESYYVPPAEAISRIQVVRGAASLQYGTQFGGLLNFVLPEPRTDVRMAGSVRQTFGSFGLSNTFLRLTGTSGKLGYYAHGQFKFGNGFRPNSEYESQHVYVRLDLATGKKSKLIGEFTWLSYLAQQAGGLTDFQFERDPSFSNRSRNWFRINWQLYALRYQSKLSRSTDFSVNLSVLNAGRQALGFRTNRVSQVDDVTAPRDLILGNFRNLSFETRLLHRYQWGEKPVVFLIGARAYGANNDATQGAGSAEADADFSLRNDEFPTYPFQSDFDFPNRNLALFAEHIIYLNPNTSITPGLRFEWIDTQAEGSFRRLDFDLAGNPIRDETFGDTSAFRRSFVLAGLGLSHKFNDQLELYANASQNYRSVTFNDIRVVNPSFQVDSNITDERGYTLDLGLRGRINRLAFDVTAFGLRYDRRLGEVLRAETRVNAEGETVETGRVIRFRGNIGDAFIFGLESLFRYDFIPQTDSTAWRVAAFVNFSVTQSEYLSSEIAGVQGKSVEFIPAWNLRTGINLRYRKLKMSVQYSFLGEQFTDATNAERDVNDNISGIVGSIPAYGILDVSTSYQFGRFQLEAGVNNALDNSYFTRRATGYPGPGIIPALPRTWYVGGGYTF